jgi:hypothetical protein
MRLGADDLSALLETARVSPSGSTVKMAAVASVQPDKNEFVGFVREGRVQHEMDYGVVISKTNSMNYVLSMASQSVVSVHDDRVVVSAVLERAGLPKLPEKALARLRLAEEKRSGVTAASGGKINMTSEEYFRQLYSYAPEYMNAVLEQVRSMAHA